MAVPSSLLARMRAITISRQYGSGGGEIAHRLAERLHWRLVDHEIIAQVAHELNISEHEAAEYDERGESTVALILSSMRSIYPAMFTSTPGPLTGDSQRYREALTQVVEAAMNAGGVVIVGRGSQVLLKDRHDALHTRIVAPLEKRIQYVMKREGLDQNIARTRIQMKEHDRQHYLQSEYRHHPDEPSLYDIIINTGVLGLDSAVDLVMLALERKAAQLDTPEEELGPGAGLPRYPGKPGDLHPPV